MLARAFSPKSPNAFTYRKGFPVNNTPDNCGGAAAGALASPSGAGNSAVTGSGTGSGGGSSDGSSDGVGPIVAGAAARSAAAIDPAREDAFWRQNYADNAYVQQGSSFDDYGPAYGFGVNAFGRYPGRSFEDAEPEIADEWPAGRGASTLTWEHAKHAVRDAWERLTGAGLR